MFKPLQIGVHEIGAKGIGSISLRPRPRSIGQQAEWDIQEIRSWFQSGAVQGGLWLPEWAYLAQDSAGTAVTAAGQVAGIWRDATWGEQLGPEKWSSVNPSIEHYAGSSGTYTVNTKTFANVVGGSDTGYPRFSFDLGLTVGKVYFVTGILTGSVGDVANIRLAMSGQLNNIPYNTTTGVFAGYAIAASSSFQIYFNKPLAPVSVSINSISIKGLPGNNGVQTTTANKPLTAVTPQTQLPWLTADATDVLPVVFPSALGSACAIARATATGVEFAESQTVNATWNGLVSNGAYNSAVCVLNRPPTAYERAVINRVLGRYVPVVSPAGAIL